MRQGPPLVLHPRACDRCGACLKACKREALRVGRTYLQVDWTRCDGCGACARACGRRAIVLKAALTSSGRTSAGAHAPAVRRPSRSTASAPVGPTPRSKSAAAREAAIAKQAASAERRPPRGGARGGFQWTLLEAAAMLSVTFSMFMVKEALSLSAWVTGLGPGWQLPVRVLVLALYYAVQVGVIIWLVRRRGGDTLSALGLRHQAFSLPGALRSAGLVLAGLVATRVVASVYAYVTQQMGLLPGQGTDLLALFGGGGAGFMLAVLMVAVVGPVVEEVVFRGTLQEGLAARFGVWPAIIAQAALFAAFHRSWWLLVPTFVLGVTLGWLAERRDSLWPPIALHALYNAITVAAAFLVSGAGS